MFDPHFYAELFAELWRVLLDGGQLYVYAPQGNGVMWELQPMLAARFTFRRQLIWHYRNGTYRGKEWGWCFEPILWASKGPDLARWNMDAVRVPYTGWQSKSLDTISVEMGKGWTRHENGARPSDVWEFLRMAGVNTPAAGHPTQKPEALAVRMVRVASDPGDLVVIPFAGSGSECAEAGEKETG